MLYSDLRREPVRQRISNYLLTFSRHFDIYRNSTLVESVSYESIVWC